MNTNCYQEGLLLIKVLSILCDSSHPLLLELEPETTDTLFSTLYQCV